MKQSQLQDAIEQAIMRAFKRREGAQKNQEGLIAYEVAKELAGTAATLGVVERDIVHIKETPMDLRLPPPPAAPHTSGAKKKALEKVLRTIYGVVFKKVHYDKLARLKDKEGHYTVPDGYLCAQDFRRQGLPLTLSQIKRLARGGHLPEGKKLEGTRPLVWEKAVVVAFATQVKALVTQEMGE